MRWPSLSLRIRIALTILCLEAVMVSAVLLATLRYSLTTTEAELAATDREKASLLQDLSRIALLTDKWRRELDYVLRKSLWGFRNNRS